MASTPPPEIAPRPRPRPDLPYLVRLWFGVREPVGRMAYAASGLALALFKYGVEAAVIRALAGNVFWPWDFLNPALGPRSHLVAGAPDWLPWAWFLWTLPFLWIAVTMSVRRMADAGGSPWAGLLVLVPLVNLVVMVTLCFTPSRAGEPWMLTQQAVSTVDRARSAASAVGLSLVVGGIMLWISVYLFATYGASLFLGTPLLMSSMAAYLFNRDHPRSFGASALVGLASVSFAAVALLLFALEGVICVAMAAPLVLPIGVVGGLLGKAISDATRRPAAELAAALVVLPLWAGGEAVLVRSTEHMVLSTVVIDAPSEIVWNHVVGFSQIELPKPWYYRLGIACPERARIVGQGVGAVRYCQFTTGSFVEPITAWQAPTRLAFDVAAQPPVMFELSPYRDVHPPHLDDYLRSTRGEFLLVPTADGRTRLEGRTWYRFEMYPGWYWTLWSDLMIHRIHQRVLGHVKQLSERREVSRSPLERRRF